MSRHSASGATKDGMDIAHNGVWGYDPLVASLANTRDPRFLVNRSDNRPSVLNGALRVAIPSRLTSTEPQAPVLGV